MSTSKPNCDTCAVHNVSNLKKLGVNMESWDFVVALAGNPNTGKSTVFNAFTGLRQHTGNWPGKTVTRAEGGFSYGDSRFKVVDLPGTYSLLSTSTDEEVARNFLLFGQPDVTILVVDATRLERNLNLVLQVLQITSRVVLCLNLVDEAKRHGMQVDTRTLARELGVPVVPTAARQKQGIDELLETVSQVAQGKIQCSPRRLQKCTPRLEQAISTLSAMLEEQLPGISNVRWVAMRLLDGDKHIIDAVKTNELSALIEQQETHSNSAETKELS